MEDMTRCHLWVEALRLRVRAQVDALTALKGILTREAEHLRRYDQARTIDIVTERVTQEVSDMERKETAARYGFTRAILIGGLLNFALGSVLALACRSEEHPLSVGACLAQSAFERDAPFGSVVIAVGPGGVPDDVKVIALSQLARESGRVEPEAAATLEACGYHVMMPESFLIALNKLKGEVLKGIVALPEAASSLERHHEGLLGT